ncbi:Vacuolar protein sorting-associated protein 70, partial [Linderina pennispora]
IEYTADLKEDEIPGDPATQYRTNLPAFHAYSFSGNVSGPLVFANYGESSDFQALSSWNVSVKGRVVLVKAGRVALGVKVQLAEQFGALGVLVFADPQDDGSGRGKVYPDGPWRPAGSLERDSAALQHIYPGDPLTPGHAATRTAPRLHPADAKNLPGIPSLPLPFRAALPLLQMLVGHGVLFSGHWTGPSPLHVNVLNSVKYEQRPIRNIIGRIAGEEEPDRAVIIGSHHDAWSAGAAGAGAGTSALLEVARGLGQLLSLGWRPRRTIILASWDASELAHVGATEWVEDNIDWLRHEAVAYLHVTGVSGHTLAAASSPLLAGLLKDVARQVPLANISHVGLPGMHSAAFQMHGGVGSLELGFTGQPGAHHANHDSLQWMLRFADPHMRRLQAIARLSGMLLLRLADDPVLALRPTAYVARIRRSLHDLERLVSRKHNATRRVRHIRHAVRVLQTNAMLVEHDYARLRRVYGTGCQMSGRRRAACVRMRKSINDRAYKLERMLTDPEGLAGRRWYRHVLLAPGRLTGTHVQEFPGLTEAALDGHWRTFRALEKRTGDILYEAAWFLRET